MFCWLSEVFPNITVFVVSSSGYSGLVRSRQMYGCEQEGELGWIRGEWYLSRFPTDESWSSIDLVYCTSTSTSTCKIVVPWRAWTCSLTGILSARFDVIQLCPSNSEDIRCYWSKNRFEWKWWKIETRRWWNWFEFWSLSCLWLCSYLFLYL